MAPALEEKLKGAEAIGELQDLGAVPPVQEE